MCFTVLVYYLTTSHAGHVTTSRDELACSDLCKQSKLDPSFSCMVRLTLQKLGFGSVPNTNIIIAIVGPFNDTGRPIVPHPHPRLNVHSPCTMYVAPQCEALIKWYNVYTYAYGGIISPLTGT